MNTPKLYTVLATETQTSDAATRAIKLPVNAMIHALFLTATCTNGGTSARNLDIGDVIDQITLLRGGSDVLVDQIVEELECWHIYENGQFPPKQRNESASAVQREMLPILFGRYPYDPEYFLPGDGQTDLELRVTFSPTISATTFATGTVTLQLIALISDREASLNYRGTLGRKVVNSFTSAASGDTQVDLPRGDPLRRILTRVYEAGIESYTNISNIKLALDNDKIVLYDLPFRSLVEKNAMDKWLRVKQGYVVMASDTDVIYVKQGVLTSAHINVVTGHDITNDVLYSTLIDTIAGDGLTVDAAAGDFTAGAEDLTADTTDRGKYLLVEGLGLPQAAMIDITADEGAEPLDTSQYNPVRLTLTNANAGAAVRVSVETVRQF